MIGLTYHRVGRLSPLPLLITVIAVAVLAGVGIFMLPFAVLVAVGIYVYRALTRTGAAMQSDDAPFNPAIRGIVVESTDVTTP